MKNVFKNLLENFVAEQIAQGRSVPSEIVLSTCLDPLSSCKPKESDIDDNSVIVSDTNIDDFIEDFNNYIIRNQNSSNVTGLCEARRQLSEEIERNISLSILEETASISREEKSLFVLNVLQQLTLIKRQFKESLKYATKGEGALVRTVEAQVDFVNAKCSEKACSCSNLFQALQRLNQLVIAEKFKYERLLQEKEKLLLRFNEVKDCRDYLHILSEYCRLLERIDMDVT